MHKRLAAVLVVLIALGIACHAAEWVDPFEEVLEPGWRWVRESSSNWSLTERDGHLRIETQMGGLLMGSDSARNLLLRDVSDGDFEIETLVDFEPVSDFQIAGLLVYEDDGNFLLLGRAYCDSCGGNMIYFDYEEDGEPLGGERLATSDLDRAYLRIVKSGSTYSGYYSENGAEWTLVGEYPGVGIRPQGVGLATTGDADPRGARVAADFAFFSLEEEGAAAAPATAPPSTGDTDESVAPVLPSTTPFATYGELEVLLQQLIRPGVTAAMNKRCGSEYRGGERYDLTVEVDRESHVKVFMFAADGKAYRDMPFVWRDIMPANPPAFLPGVEYELPAEWLSGSAYFTVGNLEGLYALVVIASESRLSVPYQFREFDRGYSWGAVMRLKAVNHAEAVGLILEELEEMPAGAWWAGTVCFFTVH